ncbi:uncharacterized protein Tco025E_02891 [Trypanosoma conorhini]|uniref:Uncharacterized protein n=1 Tax=Trypanosoma conorhini TaxID=83891 RepID=A0A422PZH0_9TRYP|nr:uncharacterized protein Tco025E_02891 [Trypanosoma conorhini]RNF23143.1 hypothetical protein Tco025E_02891 [Trypanosoma conorhini]
MQRRCIAWNSLAATSALVRSSRRGYYDKIREEREGSDDGPAAMYHEFPKNPSPNHVPEELRKLNPEAVEDAESLQRWFLLVSVGIVSALCFSGFMDPFGGEYRRPKGYGMHGGESLGPDGTPR